MSSLYDPRNLATAALYAALLALLLAARPWDVVLEWAAGRRGGALSQAQHERRWRLAVAAGLLVGPFFPASNVLFYVGTFIGERLLYFPSGDGAANCSSLASSSQCMPLQALACVHP